MKSSITVTTTRRGLLAALIIVAAVAIDGTARGQITIDTVPIGNPGNANDPTTGNLYGGVAYNYSIGKYDVTVGQYTAFLNAVAATDTYGLYNPLDGHRSEHRRHCAERLLGQLYLQRDWFGRIIRSPMLVGVTQPGLPIGSTMANRPARRSRHDRNRLIYTRMVRNHCT